MQQPSDHQAPRDNDPFRPRSHFSPAANWLNDPNGLVYYAGEYHLFYQHHPYSAVWGDMHWGHAVSPDLVHWQHLPIALYPDENGTIYSGSAVIDWHNTAGFGEAAMVLIFTHHLPWNERQSLVYSTDRGRTWIKHAGNPVLFPPPNTPDFRDPKVFWYGKPETGHWVMSLAAGSTILFYTSPNLIDWTPSGSFGSGAGATSGVWETPDLFELPVADSPAKRWVLTVGVGSGGPAGGSGTQYFIGHFDGKTFTSENPSGTILWVDHGADFYALQSWSEAPQGRRLAIAWLSNWLYALLTPTTTWRGMFSLPRQLSLRQTANGIRLANQPVEEIKTLRGAHAHWQNEMIHPGSNLLSGIAGSMLEIFVDVDIKLPIEHFGLRVRVGNDENTTIGYTVKAQTLYVDRTRSGQTDFEGSFASRHQADLLPVAGKLQLHILVDHSSVEVFANQGMVCFTESIFPAPSSQGLELFVEGGSIQVNRLDLYHLNPAKFGI